MFGIYQYGVAIYDASSSFTAASTTPLLSRTTFAGQGGMVSVYRGQTTLSSRTTFTAAGTAPQVYHGQVTVSRHPTFLATCLFIPNFHGQSTLSRHPTIACAAVFGGPVYHGVAVPQATHPVIGATSINGLFGWWQFAATGVNAGYDSTNLLHTATLVGTATGGGSLTLDGTSGYAQVSDDPFDMTLASFAVVAKATPSALDGYYRNILSKRSNSSYRGWSLFVDPTTNKIALEASDTGNIPFFRTSTAAAIAANVEYHVVAVFDRSANRMLFYLNGVLQGSVSIAGMGSLNNTILLAFGSEVGQDRWKGTLRDVRFYKRTLSASEVSTLAGGGNLYGDVPVFGTFTVPVYRGSTTVSRRPTFSSTLGKSGTLFFGGCGTSTHPVFAASGTNRVPVFTGHIIVTTRSVLFAAIGVSVVPVYTGNITSIVIGIIFSGGESRVPVYAGDATTEVRVLLHATGINRFRFFTYKNPIFIVTKGKRVNFVVTKSKKAETV